MVRYDPDRHLYYSPSGEWLPSVTQVLDGVGLTSQFYRGQRAADLGTAVHNACCLSDLGILDKDLTDPEIVGYVSGYEGFIRDSGFTILESEKLVWSKRHRYAGRLDRFGLLDGDSTLLDLKTGVLQEAAALQLAGYQCAYDEETGCGPCRRIALKLYPDGRYAIREWSGDDDVYTWLAALRVYRWLKRR